jgi:hypothetical protein
MTSLFWMRTLAKETFFASHNRGNKLKQLLGEYGCKIKAAVPLGFRQLDNFLANFPKRTKIIHRQVQTGYLRDEWNNQLSCAVHISEGSHFEILTFSVPREPEAFMKAATEAGHPKHALARVSDLLSSALREVFLGDPFKVRARRAAFLKRWMKRALKLRAEEQELIQDTQTAKS